MSNKANMGAQRRSAGRLAAVQALYSMDITGVDANQALDEFATRPADDGMDKMANPDASLVAFLVMGATAQAAELDAMIADALARDWTVDRLEAVLRAIVRAGAFEIMSRPQTPARVAISEYVDVAHAFYSGTEPGLVNAVLDKVARRLRPAEFDRQV